MRSPSTPRPALALLGGICLALLALAACRTGVPVIDTNAPPASVMGTVTGIVSGPTDDDPVAGRKITVTHLSTNETYSATTSSTGGFTIKLPPGRYRVNVELLATEVADIDDREFTVDPGELEHDVRVRITQRRSAGAQRPYQPPLPISAPIA